MMKRTIQILLFLSIPFLSFARQGIPKDIRSLIYTTTITGFFIVLFALVIVALGVSLMSRIVRLISERKKAKPDEKLSVFEEGDDIAVAIATALHLEMRAVEEDQKAILTLRKALRPFSGWNNKSYGMRNL